MTLQLGYKYSTYMNWNAGIIIYGIANNKDILWRFDIPYEIAYYIQPYLKDALYGDRAKSE